jgi:hypothetical protein
VSVRDRLLANSCFCMCCAGYKRLAVMRRAIRISALVQLVYVCIRTLWHSVPFFTGGALRHSLLRPLSAAAVSVRGLNVKK